MHKKNRFIFSLMIFLFLIGGGIIGYLLLTGESLEGIFLHNSLSLWQKIGIVSLLFLFRNYIFLPSTFAILITGVLLQDFILTLVVSSIGVAVGIIQTYFVGYMIQDNFSQSKIIQKSKPYTKSIQKHGFPVIFFGSLIPVIPVDILYYSAGIARYPLLWTLLAGVSGEYPLIILYSYIGKQAIHYTQYFLPVGGILLTLYIIFRYMKKKKETRSKIQEKIAK